MQENEVLDQFVQDRLDYISIHIVDLWSEFMYISEGRVGITNWHIEYCCQYIVNILSKKTNKFLFNMPPGHAKTTMMITLCALYIGLYPNTRFLILSSTEKVRQKYYTSLGRIMESKKFKELFPLVERDTEASTNKKNDFFMKRIEINGNIIGGGNIFVESTNSTITGTDCDFLLVDDPVDYNTYLTQHQGYIERVNNAIMGLFLRIREIKGEREVPSVIIGQRICEGDISDEIIRTSKPGSWCHVIMPVVEQEVSNKAIDTKDGKTILGKIYQVNDFKYFRRQGEFLFDKIFDQDKLEERILQFDGRPIDFQYQYYQKGLSEKGSLFNMSAIKQYDEETLNDLQADYIIQSWDTAFKTGNANDFSCCTTWLIKMRDGKVKGRKYVEYYLVDIFIDKLEYTNLIDKMDSLYQQYEPNFLLIEDKASGQSLLQEMETRIYGRVLEKTHPQKNKKIIAIKSNMQKEDRAEMATSEINSGKVFFPESLERTSKINGKNTNSLEEVKLQMRVFPNGGKKIHDDAVDTISQLLNWCKVNLYNKKREFKIWSV